MSPEQDEGRPLDAKELECARVGIRLLHEIGTVSAEDIANARTGIRVVSDFRAYKRLLSHIQYFLLWVGIISGFLIFLKKPILAYFGIVESDV